MAFPTELLNSGVSRAFGGSVTYEPAATGVPVTITAIKEDPSTLMDECPGEYIGLWVDLTTWVGDPPAEGDTIEIDSHKWTLFKIRTDGERGATLIFARTFNAEE